MQHNEHVRYVIYRPVRLLDSNKLTLEQARFSCWNVNRFYSFEDAINFLIKEGLNYEEFLILPMVYIAD